MELKVLDRPRPSELHICRISSDESAQCSADIAQRCVRRLQSGRLEIRPPSQLTWFFLKLSNSAIEPGRRKTRCCITTGSRKTFMPSSFLFCLFSESLQREIRISLSSSQPRRLVTSSRYFLVFLGLRLEFVKVRVAIEVTTDQSPHLETKTNDENCSRRILSARPHLTDASESSRRPEWTFDLSSARESAFFKGASSSLSLLFPTPFPCSSVMTPHQLDRIAPPIPCFLGLPSKQKAIKHQRARCEPFVPRQFIFLI